MAATTHFHLTNRSDIIEVLTPVSASIVEHINGNTTSTYSLWYKFITHSDLINSGKRSGPQQGLENNLLYYLTVNEMRAAGINTTAKQSNIVVPQAVYKELNIPSTKYTKFNDYVPVKVVNDSLTYFTENYTMRIMSLLGKICPWIGKSNYSLADGQFTDLQITKGDQGIGTGDDTLFRLIRHSIFLNDTIYFLIEKESSKKPTLYVQLEKNTKFYSLLNIRYDAWHDYLNWWKKELEKLQKEGADDKTIEAKTRRFQAAWKKMLAKEMMNYVNNDSEVICPFTSIKADFDKVPMLFIGSHIKRYADSDIHDKYDPNNGLLLVANADALFDKYMITVSDNKELMFSCLLNDNEELKKSLLLDHEIFKQVLNDKRMEYMAVHRRIFMEKEKTRILPGYIFDEEKENEITVDIDSTSTSTSGSSTISLAPDISSAPITKVAEEDLEFGTVNCASLNNACKLGNSKDIILVGCYKSIAHLKWIVNNKMYNVRMGKRSGSITDIMDVVSKAKILVLYNKNNYKQVRYFRLSSGSEKTGAELNELGYPQANDNNSYYVYDLKEDKFTMACNIEQIINQSSDKIQHFKKGMPIYILT